MVRNDLLEAGSGKSPHVRPGMLSLFWRTFTARGTSLPSLDTPWTTHTLNERHFQASTSPNPPALSFWCPAQCHSLPANSSRLLLLTSWHQGLTLMMSYVPNSGRGLCRTVNLMFYFTCGLKSLLKPEATIFSNQNRAWPIQDI